jgi:hypothetical protein
LIISRSDQVQALISEFQNGVCTADYDAAHWVRRLRWGPWRTRLEILHLYLIVNNMKQIIPNKFRDNHPTKLFLFSIFFLLKKKFSFSFISYFFQFNLFICLCIKLSSKIKNMRRQCSAIRRSPLPYTTEFFGVLHHHTSSTSFITDSVCR